MEERWRSVVVDCVSNYEVSDRGRVRNIRTGRILKPWLDHNGYLHVCLRRDDGRQCNRAMHKLVADAFVEMDTHAFDGERYDPVVGFKDGNRTNTHADNLEYITRSESVRRSFRKGRKQTHIMRPILCVETGEVYPSIVECSRVMGISTNSISRCVNNSFLHTVDGYHFKPLD